MVARVILYEYSTWDRTAWVTWGACRSSWKMRVAPSYSAQVWDAWISPQRRSDISHSVFPVESHHSHLSRIHTSLAA